MRLQFLVLSILVLAAVCHAGTTTVFQSERLRIRALSPTLVRIEERGPKGFEDRPTFAVVERDWPGSKVTRFKSKNGPYSFTIGHFRVQYAPSATKVSDVVVVRGERMFHLPAVSQPAQYLPAPGQDFGTFLVEDYPRIVPPKSGAAPPSAGSPYLETSGWDTTNQARDCYVFLDQGGGYQRLVKDYLRLTGPIELPPLYAFGLIDSRYYAYTQDAATKVVQTYRDHGFPLDMFVLDTDWRVGASKGYEVNTKLWPDLDGFVRQMHAQGVRTMVNDHPEPLSKSSLDPQETEGRWKGLTKLLSLGVDAWWYDRNWITHLKEPVPGLAPEIWGERVYHDVTARFRPTVRPLIMSNVQGIDNGVRNSPPQTGFHRYPIHWTGDTSAQWLDLERGVRNAVDCGVESLLPFVSEDIGGHRGHPDEELYTRFAQYGCLSPVMRLHCTAGETRFPWDFGPRAEETARKFVALRYRLLPEIYTAAARACTDGTPVLQRCDLLWPQFAEAKDSSQYLFGNDVLVAPVVQSKDGSPGPISDRHFHLETGSAGVLQSVFRGTKLQGEPVSSVVSSHVSYSSSQKPRWPEGVSIRWKTTVGPVPQSGEYVVGISTDAGVKVLWDGGLLISKWSGLSDTTYWKTVTLEQGKSYPVVVEYQSQGANPHCQLLWTVPSLRRTMPTRSVWIPPGGWKNLWTGQVYSGPRTVTINVPLEQVPMFVREGSLQTLAHEVTSTQNGVWARPVLNLNFAQGDFKSQKAMTEDDGLSTIYEHGGSAKTVFKLRSIRGRVKLEIGPVQGSYSGLRDSRGWEVKINVPTGKKVVGLAVDGVFVKPEIRQGNNDMPFSLDSGTFLTLPSKTVHKKRTVEFSLRGAA